MSAPATLATASATAGATSEQAVAAATAALAALPLPAGASAAPAGAGEVPADWPAVTATFGGARGGTVALALAPGPAGSLTSALAAATGAAGDGSAELPAACRPALEAAAAALGPAALHDPSGTTGLALAGPGAGGSPPAAAVVLVDGEPQAYLVLAFADAGAAAVPAPRGMAEGLADAARGMDLLRSVPMEVTAEIGRTRMTVQELLSLTPGALVELDRPVGSPADVLVNGRLFARGEVVVVDEDFAIRIIEIVDGSDAAP